MHGGISSGVRLADGLGVGGGSDAVGGDGCTDVIIVIMVGRT